METTVDSTLRSFIEVSEDSHFPIQNLPFGCFRPLRGGAARIGVAIGDWIVDMSILDEEGFFKNTTVEGLRVFHQPCLNPFMAMGADSRQQIRKVVSSLLKSDNPNLRDNAKLRQKILIHSDEVELLLPVEIGDYTDFYSSKEHATNVGIMFRSRENALMPNWLHLPVAYHGRASSVVVTGTEIRRPWGQIKTDDSESPKHTPSRLLDFELEMGFFIGPGNVLGSPIKISDTMDHIFGMVLVNDWSARDIQKWEYQPLGPFLGKNFATSISPWVVTMEALSPFLVEGPRQEPAPLPYLQNGQNLIYDIQLEVYLRGKKMNEGVCICQSNFRYLYWNIQQQLAHHTVNGCNVQPGDMMASGTISGTHPSSFGSMLELSWRGSKPLIFPNGEERKFIQDGDVVTMIGWCQGEGYRVGFGEVSGKILPALSE
jgi:fumarylacetoacetase